jgi:hypothetical protein
MSVWGSVFGSVWGSVWGSVGQRPSVIGTIEVYDNLNGSLSLAWGAYVVGVSSWNVYLDDVLNQNVPQRTATIVGLTIANYVASTRTVPTLHKIRIAPVIAGVESGPALERIVTPSPTSVQLTTQMKRVFPFPNTGLN